MYSSLPGQGDWNRTLGTASASVECFERQIDLHYWSSTRFDAASEGVVQSGVGENVQISYQQNPTVVLSATIGCALTRVHVG